MGHRLRNHPTKDFFPARELAHEIGGVKNSFPEWVIDHARQEDFRDLARLRYAAVLLDEKAYDEALKLLDEKHAAAYDAQYAAAKGDVLVAKNQAEQARAAYRIALDKAGSGNTAFRDSVRMRLEALGG